MQYCKTVKLRTRPIKNGMLSYYLDFYPGYRDKMTMKTIRHESLGIYIYAKPLNKREKEFNKIMTEKAEAIRCRRFESVVNERYDFFDKSRMNGDFLEYFNRVLQDKDPKWKFVYEHFKFFVDGRCRCEEVDFDLCNKFRDYLLKAKNLRNGEPMNINSVAGYWSTFRGFLNLAYRDKMIRTNPNDYLEKIPTVPVNKESLSLDELRNLYNTPCDIDVLKRASIFACLTGMRRSDIINLRWENIKTYSDGGRYVEFYAQKTKARNIIPISEEAYKLISENRNTINGLVFDGFEIVMAQKPLKTWLIKAGIKKHITFHSFRHTFASLQVELGTDLYTVMQLLAHKSVTTTQIYACHADPKRRETATKISSKVLGSEKEVK
ncbi:MAG: site-specific integrase [Prevotella sp.]|nr:site-specific integrase [Prevotella sp.]